MQTGVPFSNLVSFRNVRLTYCACVNSITLAVTQKLTSLFRDSSLAGWSMVDVRVLLYGGAENWCLSSSS